MNSPFPKYTQRGTHALDQFETLDELETNGPFNSEQYDHEVEASLESYEPETEIIDQYSLDDREQTDEKNYSEEIQVAENFNSRSAFEIAQEIEYQVKVAKASPPKKPEGRTNWAKVVLNRVLGLSLPNDNVLDAPTKKALGDFQAKFNLKPTYQIDSLTERCLLETDALFRSKGTVSEAATAGIIATAKTKIEDWTKKSVNNKPQHILNSYRDPRKVYAFVLHQMAFKRRNRKTKKYSDPESYLATGAHFCILFDGRIIQLHAFSRMIWHGNCTSPGSVAVEFEGNLPNIKGGWWIDKKAQVPDKDQATQAQFESGRFLTSYLKTILGTTHILAHRQSSDSRENDPGPDIWYNVGQWAIDKLGLTDGGPTFKCGTGNPILPEWRTWGNKANPTANPEFGNEMDNHECFECEQEMDEQELLAQEPMDEIDNTTEQEYENEMDFSPSYETEDLVRDWSEAVKSNRYYGEKLGWHQYTTQINDMLLPYSGMSNVSLGEEAFAEAVFQWQSKNGFTGNNVDGIIGPGTWQVIRKKLNLAGPSSPKKPDTDNLKYVEGVRFRRINNGWAAYGGGPLREKLYDLQNKQKLAITRNEIEMFSLVSVTESDGLVNAVNSWDDMYMSMGFIQLTIRYYELAQVIKTAPDGFRKHGIELDPNRKYFPAEKESIAIKNAPNIEDLRSFEWAKRFYYAGLEDDVIIAQIQVGRRILNTIRSRVDKTNYLNRFNDQYPNLWAFIYEAHNSRPAPFIPALTNTITRASSSGINDPVQFGKILIEQLKQTTYDFYNRQHYKSEDLKKKKIAAELVKIEHIITNTRITK